MDNVVIDDDYDHKDDTIEYILENVLMPDDGSCEFGNLRELYNCKLVHSCTCTSQIKCCMDKESCCHGGRFKYHHSIVGKELVLKHEIDLPAIIECSDLCGCSAEHCLNRCVQIGPRKQLEIFNSPLYRSLGLRTMIDIPAGAFVCEYAGELLTLAEARRRLKLNDREEVMNYILCLNEYTNVSEAGSSKKLLVQSTIVDPSRRGNIGRYLNHSCQPNCDLKAVRVDSPVPKIGIFALRDIAAYEELCFHYGGDDPPTTVPSNAKPCLCSSSMCTGVMPNTTI
ncbi:probable histone-lysine N-methyltransferase set-23 [Scaptodrosophila lebanonensis]|uniref:Probable histone-lysine N-methyltransferase set-23 n=1 Tax=Drosophila lebanonensis TaxID=7225 RepID=A0A6J2SZH4_DROLE|nr:probable histone-lysine N-methyltransferase set-23 [Scaptodrosophila lebanonensis]XP_030370002.1 probable histone-lysine N-methyltransferase set-23 [Scaptodrosophila lebanonensis]